MMVVHAPVLACWLGGLAALAAAGGLDAQDPPFRSALRSVYRSTAPRPGESLYAEVWGTGGQTLVAYYAHSAVDVVDISDPDRATLAATWIVPPPNETVSAQDVKANGALAFVCLEGNGPDAAAIVDIRDPARPRPLTYVRISGFTSPHNLFHADGWLYLVRMANQGVAIVDLRGYDPDRAPALITQPAHMVFNTGAAHDVTVANGRMWLSDINGSIKVYDVSDLAARPPALIGQVKGGLLHSSWPTADGRFLVTCDESFGGPVKLFEVNDSGSAVDLIQRDAWVSPLTGPGAAGNPHNPAVDDDRVYLAYNAAGVLCLQIDRVHKTWERVASFDTSTITPRQPWSEGCWGVYPFLGADRVPASDRQEGMHVLDFSGLELSFTAPRPGLVAPFGAPTTLCITIEALGAAVLDPTTAALLQRIDGGAWQRSPMVRVTGNQWQAAFASAPCGSRIDYYVSARDLKGVEFTRPGEAPGAWYTAFAAPGMIPVFRDDFTANRGWTTRATAPNTAGAWQRGVPVDNGFQPARADPDAGDDHCFVTEIGTGGADDVDGGQVTLTSPLLDFSAGDGVINYRRWYHQDDADGAQSEPFLVEISDDGGASWATAESVLLSAGGWQQHAFRVSEFVTPTARVAVRFVASDEPNNSLVEAGVDSFVAARFDCTPPAASASSRNGTAINPAGFTTGSLPVLGSTWRSDVDHATQPNALYSVVLMFAAASAGPVTGFGELLVDPGSPLFSMTTVRSRGGRDRHDLPIPLDPALAGLTATCQAVVVEATFITLYNAIDIRLGF